MKKKLLIAFKLIGETFLFWVFWFFAVVGMASCIENMIIQEEVKDFINSAEFVSENGAYVYYAVYTDELIEPTITFDEYNVPNLGYTGDIFLMPKSNMDMLPFTAQFIGFYFGGHAGIVGYDEKRLTNEAVEALGGASDETYIDYDLFSDVLRPEKRNVIGMRGKAPLEDREKAWEYAKTLNGKPYNYLFIVDNKDKYYCTDLCARVYGKEAGLDYNLEWNGFATSTQDIALSKDTYISYIKIMKDDKYYIYYLANRGE